jgi:hypothetical protein
VQRNKNSVLREWQGKKRNTTVKEKNRIINRDDKTKNPVKGRKCKYITTCL